MRGGCGDHRPFARSAARGRALSRADRDCRESEEKLRELSELARKQEEQLEHSTRLAELGEMAAAISHELNQPLTGIRNYARNAFYMIDQKAGGEEEVKDNLRLISEQVDRAARIINQMRELTRRSDSVVHPPGGEQRHPRMRGVPPAADEALRGRP